MNGMLHGVGWIVVLLLLVTTVVYEIVAYRKNPATGFRITMAFSPGLGVTWVILWAFFPTNILAFILLLQLLAQLWWLKDKAAARSERLPKK